MKLLTTLLLCTFVFTGVAFAENRLIPGLTETEQSILDGATVTTSELNILDGVTATAAEINTLDGVTAAASELNILDGVTATSAELNYNDITTLGTGAASKAVVLDASADYTYPATATIKYASGGTLQVNSTDGAVISAIRTATDPDLDNGQTSEVVTVTGATASSLCFATITIDATNDVAVSSVVPAANQVTVTVTGDPGASGADLAVVCFN